MVSESTVRNKVIRDRPFAIRFEQACDDNLSCPPLHKGRLVWVATELGKRTGKPISVQTVARWMNGEAKPRQDKNIKLAELLDVDSTWLYLGVEQNLAPRERKLRNAMVDGAVNVVAGLIQMDGGHPAFPDEKDARAVKESIDIYAVIRGASYAFHVTLGLQKGDDWHFIIPVQHEGVIVLGVVREDFDFRIVELSEELIEAIGINSGRAVTLVLSDNDIEAKAIKSFAQRL